MVQPSRPELKISSKHSSGATLAHDFQFEDSARTSDGAEAVSVTATGSGTYALAYFPLLVNLDNQLST